MNSNKKKNHITSNEVSDKFDTLTVYKNMDDLYFGKPGK